jgi:hypothetical protein
MYTEWQRFVREYGHTLSGKDLLDNTDSFSLSVHGMSVLSNNSLALSVCPYSLTNLFHSVYMVCPYCLTNLCHSAYVRIL